jgi:hypothetical protein
MNVVSKFRRNMKRIPLLSLLAAIVLTSCMTNRVIRAEFDQSLEKYNELIRWQDADRAGIFSSASNAAEFRARAEAAKRARVVDYQIVDVRYDEKTREASAVVVFSYYMSTSALVKKVTDNQKWGYTDEGGVKSWRLMSPLPEFR